MRRLRTTAPSAGWHNKMQAAAAHVEAREAAYQDGGGARHSDKIAVCDPRGALKALLSLKR